MLDPRIILVGVALNLWGSIGYAISTARGKTQPNRVTWFLWFVIPMIAFSAQISSGVYWESVLTFMVGFGPLLVVIASFTNPKAYWKIGRLDVVCGAISVMAILLWLSTDSPLLALMFSILADFLAAVPTIVKAFAHPESENSIVYRNGMIAAAITLLTISVWEPINFAFAVYILMSCASLYVLVRFKLGQKLRPRSATS